MLGDIVFTTDDILHFKNVIEDVMVQLGETERDIIEIDRLVKANFKGDPVVKEVIHNGLLRIKTKLDLEMARLLK